MLREQKIPAQEDSENHSQIEVGEAQLTSFQRQHIRQSEDHNYHCFNESMIIKIILLAFLLCFFIIFNIFNGSSRQQESNNMLNPSNQIQNNRQIAEQQNTTNPNSTTNINNLASPGSQFQSENEQYQLINKTSKLGNFTHKQPNSLPVLLGKSQNKLFQQVSNTQKQTSDHLEQANSLQKVNQQRVKQIMTPNEQKPTYWQPFPKVLWLVTRRPAGSQYTFQGLVRNSIKHFASLANYEVMIQDVWTANKYLSEQILKKITDSMHGKQVDVQVLELIKLALLIEHGGVLFEVNQLTLIEDLTWIEQIFEGREGTLRNHFKCENLWDPQVFMFQSNDFQQFPIFYRKQLIAARKNNILIKSVFEDMLQMAHTGRLKFRKYHENAIEKDSDKNILRFRFFLERTIANKLSQIQELKNIDACKYYKLQTINLGKHFNVQKSTCQRSKDNYYLIDRKQLFKDCGEERFWLKLPNVLVPKIVNLWKDKDSLKYHENSYLNQVILQGSNKDLLRQENKTREVHICILSLHQIPKQQDKYIQESVNELKKQSFKQWTAVYLLKEGQFKEEDISETQRVVIGISKGNKGLDSQIVIVKMCPNNSIVFILNYKQRLRDDRGLEVIASSLKIKGTFGAFIPLYYKEKRLIPKDYPNFNRQEFYMYKSVKTQALNEVINHFRVFESNLYKIIPKFDLHRLGTGQYYEDRLLYLMSILEIANKHKLNEWHQLDLKLLSMNWDIPQKTVVLQGVEILTDLYEQYNKDQLAEIKYKFPGLSMRFSIQYFNINGISFDNFFIFNDGEEPPTYKKREGLPEIIPKLIHQIWIYGNLPPIKAYIAKKNQQLHPQYKYKIWKRDDVNAHNFPYTHRILKRLLEFENKSPYSKMAMMADIMRGQILYHNGGFYFDSTLQFFKKSFDDWLTYKMVMPVEQIFRNRASGQICFLASMPKNPLFLRVLEPANTNQYNIYSERPDKETGPANFQKLTLKNEEMDPDRLFIPYQFLFPAANVPQLHPDLCIVDEKEKGVVAVEKGMGLLGDCGKLYPLQIGSEHYRLGGSWRGKKERKAKQEKDGNNRKS